MVELLATFGAAAKELFDYNREMYQFDQGQRLDRELLRLEMQIKRFQLFREDVRDLVELTVAKMEMYHVVGALVLECTVIYYTEGRIRTSAPPFLLGLYWLSAAGTFTYVLLCVWFSMYASISSHSFGVRLLTRFVRLPIPGSQQMSAMNARLTDFERQGGNIMRIPFMQGVPQWQQRRKDAGKNPSSTGQGEGDDEYLTAVVKPGEMKQQDLLESGVPGYADDEGVLQQAAVNLPGKHIKLFRELQAKWQCYDAYARVCMSFGVNHICMTMSYYMIGLTVLEYRSPSIMFALVTVFQATNLALAWLDVAGLKRKTTTFLEFIGAVPPFLTCFCMACAPYEEAGRGQFDPEHEFPYASVSFFITAIWLEGLLHLAWPSEDLAMLPKRFRSVLFLDVFGMADDVKAGEDTNAGQPLVEISREDAEAADEALSLAEAAVRRWNALPMGTEEAQKHQAEIQRLYAQAFTWRKVLNGEAAKRAAARGDFHELDLLEPDMRSWNRLTEEEKEEDPFADSLLGPFVNQHNETYYYHLESMEFVWKPEDDQGVLSLTQVSTLVKDAEQTVTDLFHGREDLIRSEDSDLELNTRKMIVESCFYVLRCCNKRRRPMERERRLPWRVLLSVTRVSQLSWLLLGLSILGQNTGLLPKFDLLVEKSKEEMESSESSEHKDGESERRLQAEDWDVFSMNGSALPKGLVSAMSCHPASEGCNLHLTTRVKTDGSSSVWNASTFASTTVSFEAAKNISLSSISSSILCPDNEALDPCFLDVVGDGLKLRTQKEDLEVSASLMPDVRLMQKISGAVLRCKILKLGEDISGSEWCLLFAGWDGRRLPVAVVPFPQSLGNGRELVERLQEKLKALNNELAARKEEADRCKKDLLEEQAKNRRLAEARRGQKAGKEVATIQDDQQREQEMDLQTANVRRFMESTLQEKVKRDSTQNELGIRIYDEVELMVEKSADEQAQESKYIDTVLVTYCIANSELKYNLSFRVDRNMKTKKLREDACLYWGLSEVEFILKTMSNAKVHDELAIQSCFRENEDAHFSLVQKTPKNATLMDRELLHIMPKAGRKARRVAKQTAKRDEAKGDAATRTGVGDLAEQMLLLPGLFRYMTQRDKNVKQHLQRLKLRNICIYLTVLVMTIVDIYMRIPPALAFNCRQGVLELMTEGDGQGLSFDDIRSSDQVWLWLSDTVADQLLVPSSPLRTYNYPVGYLQVRLQEVQIPTQAQCPQLDLAYSVPENVTCFATRYTASKANTIEDDGVRHYFYGKSGYAGRYVNSAPWSFGNERSTSPAGEPWILGHFDEFDGSGQSIEYDLQYSPLDELRQAFLNDMLFLQGQNWLDPQSRALHVSFLLYNSNYDHFISNRYTVEMTAFGVVRPFSEIGVFRPGFVEYDLGFSMLSLDIIRLCFVLLICPVQIYWDFMYERRVNGAGCKHLYSVQGLADLAVGIIFFVMFGLRYGNFNVPSIDYFVQQAQTPLDAGEFAEQYNFHIVMDALISGLLLYRFAFFLRINRHFFLIWSTVEQAAMVGCRLLVIAVPVVVGLILVSMAVGGSYDENSRSFWSSLMRVMLLIYADVETVKDYDPNRGWQLSFNVALYFLMRLVFVNCWISVLIHEYQKVRVAAGSTETYRWKEYDYVVWCLPWPFRNLYLNFLRPKIERPAKDSVEE